MTRTTDTQLQGGTLRTGFGCECCQRQMDLRIDGKFCNECYHSRRAAVAGPRSDELLSQMWQALIRETCINPVSAKTVVFLGEEKFRKALAPFAAATASPAPAESDRLPVSPTPNDYVVKEDNLMSTNYDGFRVGMLRAAEMARNEFKRAPEAAKGHDCVYMGGYEDACDHLSAIIAQAAVIDNVRIAGAQPDWQYHISLLLPDGIDDETLLKIYQVVEHELRAASSNAAPPESTRVAGEARIPSDFITATGELKDWDAIPSDSTRRAAEAQNRDKAQEIILATEAALSEKFDSIARHELVNRITIALNAAAPADNDAESRRLLTECCYTIQQLAEQQAMPDNFYERTLQAVGRFLEPDTTTKGDR